MIECPYCGISVDDDVQQCGYCKSYLEDKQDANVSKEELNSQSLKTITKQIETSCILCNAHCLNGEILSNGSVYHEKCFRRLKENIENIEIDISAYTIEIINISHKIRETHSVLNRIKSFIFRERPDIETMKLQIQEYQQEIHELKIKGKNLRSVLSKLYNYWPDYPPDWEERKQKVRQSFPFCDRCGEDYSTLHVHHKIRISRGGDHTTSNLTNCIM